MSNTLIVLAIALPLLAVLGYFVFYKLIYKELERSEVEDEEVIVGDYPNLPKQLKDDD